MRFDFYVNYDIVIILILNFEIKKKFRDIICGFLVNLLSMITPRNLVSVTG